MSLSEVLEELPRLSLGERQLLVRRALELDDPELSVEEEAVVDQRLAEHRENPGSALSLSEIETRLRSRFGK